MYIILLNIKMLHFNIYKLKYIYIKKKKKTEKY